MKRIIIIGEGQTEQSFCNDVLQPHFNALNIYIQNPVIKKTGGGIVNWEALKYQIELHLLKDKNTYVTTLIDYYGLHVNHKYPNWAAAEKQKDKNVSMDLLESGMYLAIAPALQSRFIPYIQLHEFEALLFSDISVFQNNFEDREFLNYKYLEETISSTPNPEMINNGSTTAPSKRLADIIKNYSKIVYGSTLAHDIGLRTIRTKCPRFNAWINKLESL